MTINDHKWLNDEWQDIKIRTTDTIKLQSYETMKTKNDNNIPASILIVDDEDDMRSTLSELLTDDGYKVLSTSDGKKAEEIIKESNPNIILTDVKMPGVDGIRLLQKAKEINKDIEVILMTGFADVNTAIKALELGAYAYLRKPFEDTDDILNTVEKALNRQSLIIQNRKLLKNLKESNQELQRKNFEIENLNKELDKKVRERTLKLEHAYKELKKLDELKSHFIMSVSHELRTPLTAIVGSAELLIAETKEPSLQNLNLRQNETNKELINIIYKESQHLNKLLSDIIITEELLLGKVEWHDTEVSFKNIINNLSKTFYDIVAENTNGKTQPLPKYTFEFQIKEPIQTFYGDESKLLLACRNLISNAVKFSPNGGKITLTVLDKLDYIEVIVSDTGIGIPEDEISSIFELFTQVGDIMTNKPRGIGLGLTITKEIVQHYNGKIWCESVLNKGSSFHFTLPFKRKEKVILVIDDDQGALDVIRTSLTDNGWKLIMLDTGENAIEKFKEINPDMVLLDVMLPKVSGYEICRQIKKHNDRTPVVFMSALGDEPEILHGLQQGADDYIPKPFNINELSARLKNIFHRIETNLDANPLTGLPGNNRIRKEIENLLTSNKPFAICYFDLNNFKSYNDVYGFENGDRVIKFTSDCIQKSIKELLLVNTFLGHIGGDDFVLVMPPEKIQEFCINVISKFDEKISTFYNDEDKRRGYIISENRVGNKEKFPIIGLSIGIVTNLKRKFSNVLEISEVAAEVKHKAKMSVKSSYYIDQRA